MTTEAIHIVRLLGQLVSGMLRKGVEQPRQLLQLQQPPLPLLPPHPQEVRA